jgi:hypothetical protein
MTPSGSAAQSLPGGRDAHQICSTCRWGWHFEDQELDPAYALGECHRHAPRPNPGSPASHFQNLWPIVHGSQGCGDWTTRFLS